MKKIISILIALGLVLSLTVMATPVAADVTEPVVDVFDTDCACDPAAGYNITFNITASLTEGVHEVCIEFPADTTVPASFKDGEIKIGPLAGPMANVFAGEITVVGNKVCFLVPVHLVTSDNPIRVTFETTADIGNPCTAGEYKLKVNTSRDPDSAQVESAEYTIRPEKSDWALVVDFSEMYPGIALDFVPPFKACGQNTSVTWPDLWDADLGDYGGFWEPFVLNFTLVERGCAEPCHNVTMWFELIACPEDEVISFAIMGVPHTLTAENVTEEVGVRGEEDVIFDEEVVLGGFLWHAYFNYIHFSSPGTYELCFYAECPAVVCEAPDVTIIAERCLEFEVHQWKDAANITIDEKWNLLSLPLVPFDSSIENMLESLPAAAVDDLISIWHYDRCSETWYVYDGNAHEDLTDIVDGKAYWFRMDYPIDGTYTWWVWGTEMPEPEASPAEYAVCEGWNMVGFTSLDDMDASLYLWNWAALWPVVYGWTQGDWTVQGWDLINVSGGDDLVSGQGYWMAFPADGAIYVPTP